MNNKKPVENLFFKEFEKYRMIRDNLLPPSPNQESECTEPVKRPKLQTTTKSCFVCGDTLTEFDECFSLMETATKRSRTKLPNKLAKLIGDKFVITVCADDVICVRCTNLLDLLDRFQNDAEQVRAKLMSYLHNKYRWDDEDGDRVVVAYRPKKKNESKGAQQAGNDAAPMEANRKYQSITYEAIRILTEEAPENSNSQVPSASLFNVKSYCEIQDIASNELELCRKIRDLANPFSLVESKNMNLTKFFNCFICDAAVEQYDEWHALLETATLFSGTKYSQKIAEVVGSGFVVIVSPQNVACMVCGKRLNYLDGLEEKTARIGENIINNLNKRYRLWVEEDVRFTVAKKIPRYQKRPQGHQPQRYHI